MLTASISVTNGSPLKFHPVPSLESLPGIEWLITDILPAHGIAVLYGEPGHGKSFAAIDMSLAIAAGRRWQTKDVIQGSIVYIVGEGSRGMKDRMKAWQTVHPDADVNNAFVILEPIMLHDRPSIQRFVNAMIKEFKDKPSPVLIVIDTLAQNAVGMDENSAQDMGVWLHGARMLQERFGSTILIVHHAARGSGRERGSTALRGAADTMILMRRPSDKLNAYKMSCTKQKEGECFPETLFEIAPVEGTSSAVMKLAAKDTPMPSRVKDDLTTRVNTLAATMTLSQGVEALMLDFPELTPVAAKSRLARARSKSRAGGIATPHMDLSLISDTPLE